MTDRGLKVIEKPLIFFDLETTHADVSKAQIVEIGAIKVLPNSKIKKLEMRIRPRIDIPQEAIDIHGITNEDVKGLPLFEVRAKEIFEFFEGCDVSGFNVQRFDLIILGEELSRAGYRWDLGEVSVVDTMRIYHMREPRDLSAAVAHYTGKFHVGAHSAMADAEAAMSVLLGQLEHYQDLPTTPSEICETLRSPNAVDFGEKLYRNEEGEVCWSFGKYKGDPVWKVPSYIEWALKSVNLGSDAKSVLHDVLARKNTRVNP